MIVMSITFILSCNKADKPLTNNEQEIRELWDRFTNSICNGNWRVFYRNVFLGYFNENELRTKEQSVRLETNLV